MFAENYHISPFPPIISIMFLKNIHLKRKYKYKYYSFNSCVSIYINFHHFIQMSYHQSRSRDVRMLCLYHTPLDKFIRSWIDNIEAFGSRTERNGTERNRTERITNSFQCRMSSLWLCYDYDRNYHYFSLHGLYNAPVIHSDGIKPYQIQSDRYYTYNWFLFFWISSSIHNTCILGGNKTWEYIYGDFFYMDICMYIQNVHNLRSHYTQLHSHSVERNEMGKNKNEWVNQLVCNTIKYSEKLICDR